MLKDLNTVIQKGSGPRHLMLVATLMMVLVGCSARQLKVDSHESLNAALWTQTSAEYIGNTMQAYRAAGSSLDRALANPKWTAAVEQSGDYSDLPPAVMLDLDQTVLDTSSYNADIILQYGAHSSEKFNAWCRQSTAPAIAGAKEFLDYAVELGVTVIYYSARREILRECTTSNLRALGLPLPDQERLLLNDGTSSAKKAQQRTRLASQFRILLLVGDNLDDFVSGSKIDAASRRSIARQHAGKWGREWIILPNPMYGHWEFSLYDFDYALPRDKKLQYKLQQLQR